MFTIFIPEAWVPSVVQWLYSVGAYAVPTDNCECLYWSFFQFVLFT